MQDFIIIGGGIAGLSSGGRLARLGHVTLLEAEDSLGYHTSGRSAAVYEPDYGMPATVAVAHASRAELAELGVLSPRGILMVCAPGDEALFETDIVDLKLNEISPAEAAQLFPLLDPAKMTRAAYAARPQDIDADRLLQIHAKRIRDNGGEICLKSRVDAIERLDTGWRVTAGGKVHEGKRLVNAAGSWADHVAEMAGIPKIGLRPLKRSMAVIPVPEGRDMRAAPMVMGAGEQWYSKPQGGTLLVSPCDQEPVEPHDAWPDDMVLAEGLARFEAHMNFEVSRLQASWAGIRTKSPDGALVLGPDPLDPSFVWVAGQGGQGMQSSSGASMVVAETVGGPPSGLSADHLAALSPARYR